MARDFCVRDGYTIYMTKGQLGIVILVIVIALIGIAVAVHNHTQSATQAQTGPTAEQTTAASDCIELCQTVYDESGASGVSNQEQACENVCNKSAGISASTTATSQ